MPNAMSWLNEPPQWSHEGDVVRVVTGPKPETVDVGVMCCSPEREGLEVTFTGFRVGEPIQREGLE